MADYTVYRMTIAEALERFRRETAADPDAASRRISFFYNDQFTYKPRTLAPPPEVGGSQSTPNTRSTITAGGSQASSNIQGSGGAIAGGLNSSAPEPSGRLKEAGRGGVRTIGELERIADPGEREEALRQRALAIGRREYGSCTDLISMLKSEFHEVRRLAASALKKCLRRDRGFARLCFRPLVAALTRESFPQVRQYMLAALKCAAKGADRESVDYLADVARDPTLPAPLREAADRIVCDYEAHRRLKESVFKHWCHRCKRPITKEESAAGLARYGKPYCRHCFEERSLGDVCFEKSVEGAKIRRTLDGVAVQSLGEKRIADWLAAHGIAYEYDERFRIVEDTEVRPDFYLREFDLYIEYWGMDTDRYNANRRKKLELYQRSGRKLISLSFEDDRHLEERLHERLAFHIPLLNSATSPDRLTPRHASSVGGSDNEGYSTDSTGSIGGSDRIRNSHGSPVRVQPERATEEPVRGAGDKSTSVANNTGTTDSTIQSERVQPERATEEPVRGAGTGKW